MFTRRQQAFVVLFTLIVLSLAGAAYLRVRWVAHAASQFLQQVKNMPVGKVSEKQVRDLWQQYHQYGGLEKCSDEHCELELHFSNVWISTWRLAPFTDLYGVFIIDKGVPSAQRVGILTLDDMLDVWEDPPNGDRFKVFSNTPQKLQILLTSEASLKERMDAYNLNANCLTRLGGCKSTEQMNRAIGEYKSSGPFFQN